MNKQQELIQKIIQIETQAQNIKATLKEQANHIGRYHKALKEVTNLLESIKKKLTIKDNNDTINNQQGGNK
ncbi:hypothetical protein [endosymbiont GvMRE of Glomus versiforme]|uniref:hypothetical protein n=1 Tax=endosymbiont GvMRE of Glomus versiforme TaxID=2039283 RepID=UPI000ECB9FF0|nr:hypothetical protein [endosymbiont GvMRE of Glomus versiforme]RHZ35896.1 hypothetical protein GvMRE_Ic4g127 [endosymbiont GvMRE of Glomus versiforme]